MLIPAAIAVAVAVWDVTRRIGARRDEPELQEGGLVFGAAVAFVGVLVVVALNPPTVTIAGETVRPPLQVAVEWGLSTAVNGASAAAAVLFVVEGVLLAAGRIDAETTLVRYADAGASGEVSEG